jgi:hypothetical protein
MIQGIQLLLFAFFFLATSTEASEINKSFELSENLSQSGEKECLAEIHGSLTYKGYRYVKQIENDNRTITDEFIAALEVSGIMGQQFKYFFTPVYRIDNANLAIGVLEHFEEDSQNRNMININEARIEIGSEQFLLSIGKQFFAWGEADGYNPSDNLCAKDFTDLLDDENWCDFLCSEIRSLGIYA